MIVDKSRYEFLISTLKKTQWDEKVPALLQPSEWQSNSLKGCVAFHNRIFVTNCPRKISMHAFALLFTITSSLLSVHSHHPYHHHHHHHYHHHDRVSSLQTSSISETHFNISCVVQLPRLQAAISDFSLEDFLSDKVAKVERVKLKRFYCSPAPTSDMWDCNPRPVVVLLGIYNVFS